MVMLATKPAEGTSISRARIGAFSATSSARGFSDMMTATEICDFECAAAMAFARAQLGEDVPAGWITQILPGIRDIMVAARLCAIASSDRSDAWMACLHDRMIPVSSEASPIEMIVLYAAWRAGASISQFAPEARRLVNQPLGWRGYALLYALGRDLGDRHVRDATRHLRVAAERAPGPGFVASIDRILSATVPEIIDALPADDARTAPAFGYTIRLAARTGRNEPCPCGSGQKYKRCCADMQEQILPSPVAGLSWDQYVTTAGDRMSPDEVHALPLRDLGRVDLGQLRELSLVAAIGRFVRERLFMKASFAANKLAHRGVSFIDDLRVQILIAALEANDLDTAREQVAAIKDPTKPGLHGLELALRDGRPDAMASLASVADAAISDDESSKAVDLAHTLLRAAPGLGILVARGCLRSGRAVVNENLLRGIEDTRDAMNVPPGDPAWDIRAALTGDDQAHDDEDDEDTTRIAAETAELRSSLHAASGRLGDLERVLAETQAELARSRDQTRSVIVAPSDLEAREHVARLRVKVEELQSLVCAGNSERTELRRHLAASSSAGASAKKERTTNTERDDDATCEPLPVQVRGFSIPDITRRAQDALADVPASVAAEAMRTVGHLAAGDPSAWRSVKQAKDMSRLILMARVGIHHRMLFRIEDRTLEVLDVVSRESLLITLKRLR